MIATCPNPSCRGEQVTYADPKSGGTLKCRRCEKTYKKSRWKWREEFTIYHQEQFVRASELGKRKPLPEGSDANKDPDVTPEWMRA